MQKKYFTFYYIALALFAGVYWLVTLTPLNLHDKRAFIEFIILMALFILPIAVSKLVAKDRQPKSFWESLGLLKNASVKSFRDFGKRTGGLGLLWIPVLLIFVYGLLSLSSLELFRSKQYAHLLQVHEGDFSGNIAEIDFTEIPTVDRDTAQRLGSKKMGEIADLVSQFEVDPDYTQINFQGRPVRVTPLRYGDIIKWLNNRSEGLPRIIRVDMIDSAVTLQSLTSGMKYSHAEPLFRNINRHLRLCYPFDILDEPVMEIDESGTPFWVTPVISPRAGWFGGRDVKAVILCNALTGETAKYDVGSIPTWVDRVYPADMVLRQINYYGKYQTGFINAYIGQKGVLQATALYNYLAIDDDVYLYTGITSVSTEDNSNLGFVLVNLRTKETMYYAVASADESSAMRSAEGAVQEKGYQATIPILLNISGRPTYCMALKDQASLVKMYALTDAQNYQTTGVGASIKEAMRNYEISQNSRLKNEPDTADKAGREKSLTGKVKAIQAVTIEGNSYYYFMLESGQKAGDKSLVDRYFEKQVFSAPVSLSSQLPFLKAGDRVTVEFYSPVAEDKLTEEDLKLVGQRAIDVNSLDLE